MRSRVVQIFLPTLLSLATSGISAKNHCLKANFENPLGFADLMSFLG